MPKYFTSKQERMYEHVKDSTGSKREAAATVNKFRSKHGLTKKKGKAYDIETVEAHVAGTGKSKKKKLKKKMIMPGELAHTDTPAAAPTPAPMPAQPKAPKPTELPDPPAVKSYRDIEGPVRARGRDMPRVAGTKQPKAKRHEAPTPGSSTKKLNDTRKSLTNGGVVMRTFEDIFNKSTTGKPEKQLRKSATTVDEESSELEESVAKGEEEDELLEAADDEEDEESGEVAKGGEEGEEAFPCPHCASDVTVSDVKNAITKGEIHRKGVGGSPKGHQKHGTHKPARTAVTDNHGGGTSHNGKPRAGTESPPRGVKKVPKQPHPPGSYAKSFVMGSPLMTISKSEGPAGDDAIARQIAKNMGVPLEDVGLTDEE